MKISVCLCLALALKASLGYIFHANNPHHSVPESNKLQIKFSRSNEPVVVTSNHEILSMKAGTTNVIVNKVNPYEHPDNSGVGFVGAMTSKDFNIGSTPVVIEEIIEPPVEPEPLPEVYSLPSDSKGVVLNANVHKFDPQGHYNTLMFAAQTNSDKAEPVAKYGHEINGKPYELTPEFYGHYTDYSNKIKQANLENADEVINYLEHATGNNAVGTPVMLDPQVVRHIIDYLNTAGQEQVTSDTSDPSGNQESENIEKLKQDNSDLNEKIQLLVSQTEDLNSQIQQLKAQGYEQQAESLEKEEADLETQKLELELEAEKKEDIEIREKIAALESEKEELQNSGNDLEAIVRVEEEIANLEYQISQLDEDIKEHEVDIIEEQVHELEYEKHLLSQEEVLDSEHIEEVQQQIDEALSEEQAISQDTQVEDELDQGLSEIDTSIQIAENFEDNNVAIEELEKIKRRLKAKRELIEEINKGIDLKVENDLQTYGTNDSKGPQSDTKVDAQVSSDNANSDITDPSGTEDSEAGIVTDLSNVLVVSNEKVSFGFIPFLLIADTNLSVDYTKAFSILPASVNDIPDNLLVNADQLNYLYGQLKVFEKTFKNHAKHSEANYKYLHETLATVKASREGMIEFYKLEDSYSLLDKSNTNGTIYKMKLGELYANIDLMAETMKILIETINSVDTLRKLTEEVLVEFRGEIKDEETMPVSEKSTLSVKYIPRLIEYRKEFNNVFNKIRQELIEIRDNRLPTGIEIERLIRIKKASEAESTSESSLLDGSNNQFIFCALAISSIVMLL